MRLYIVGWFMVGVGGCLADMGSDADEPSEAARIAARSGEIVEACENEPDRDVFVDTPTILDLVPCSSVLAISTGPHRSATDLERWHEDPFFDRDMPGGDSGGGVRITPFGVACQAVAGGAAVYAQRYCRNKAKGAGGAGPSQEEILRCVEDRQIAAAVALALCSAL
jgi:hypothetical protein